MKMQFKETQPCCEAKKLKKHLKAPAGKSGGKARQMNTNGKHK